MVLLYFILFIVFYLSPRVECFRAPYHNSRKQMAEHRNADRFRDDSYIYSADYLESKASDYEEDTDYDRNSREQKRSASAGLGDIVDLSSFSDGEVSMALSMLTEHELDQLDRLIDDDQADRESFMMKRETNNGHKKKRECQGEACNESAEKEEARVARDTNHEKDQLASFRSWFTRNKTTKTTRRPTKTTMRTTRRPSVRTTKRTPVTKPIRRTTTARFNKGRSKQRYLGDNNNILRYGRNNDARELIDSNVKDKIDSLTSKIKKRDQTNIAKQTNKRATHFFPLHTGMNRHNQEAVVRQKRNSFAPESGGTLDDSFPHPNDNTASFHTSMEPLVRVKRGPFGV
ncbi:uncharacterized protein LOC110676497 isoform X2 [Aedes aegypti]|uniref:Uncharacterized protein n=1 Tax=Aedes aegypti TaxID=7159 RepID=A0A6I8U513_AEDAE|nr:uncharacterized protein LOC110676497 isoform X2 [Aedes aegypti]